MIAKTALRRFLSERQARRNMPAGRALIDSPAMKRWMSSESARIDGASRWQQVLHITLPLLRPIFIIMLLMGIGRIFYGDFGMIYGIVGDNGVLFPTTDVIDTYSYRTLRQVGNLSMSSAVVLYQSVMGIVTIIVFNGVVRRIEPDVRLF